jgi:hypothetical protein
MRRERRLAMCSGGTGLTAYDSELFVMVVSHQSAADEQCDNSTDSASLKKPSGQHVVCCEALGSLLTTLANRLAMTRYLRGTISEGIAYAKGCTGDGQ